MDYQNVHLTAHGLFDATRFGPRHEALIDPLDFGNQLIQARNARQRHGMAHASLDRVIVHRGLPSQDHDPKAYARNQAQQAHWQRDKRVAVHLRPLKYVYEYDADGNRATGDNGKWIVKGKTEKGVDVLCALALVRQALDPDIDLAILASQDSDLEPALTEAVSIGSAKIETFSWYNPVRRHKSTEISCQAGRLWNTRLGETEFKRCWDTSDYR